MTGPEDTGPSVEETLSREAEGRPLAGSAAVAAGLATLAGTVVYGEALRHQPEVTIPEALRDAAQEPPSVKGLLADKAVFIHDHVVALTVGQVLIALSAPLAAIALLYLARSVIARRPEFSRRFMMVLIAGAVATVVGALVGQISVDVSVSDFVSSSDHTTAAAHDALQPGAALAAGFITFLGNIALGFALVMISLNAMRSGLLTRFMGVLGIMAGVFLAFPFFPVPIVQAFWLVALGVLIFGRWPGGMPPAWETGRAEPWPSRQQMMEARGTAAASDDSEPTEAPGDAPRPAHPRSKKKKRRR